MPVMPPGGNARNQYLCEGVDTVCDQQGPIGRNILSIRAGTSTHVKRSFDGVG